MSAGISNLGMGYDPQRVDSTPVLTGADYAAQQSAALAPYQQALSNIQAPQTLSQYANPYVTQAATDLYNSYKAAGLDIDPNLVMQNQQTLFNNQQGGFSSYIDRASTVGGFGNLGNIDTYAQVGLPQAQASYQQQQQQAAQALAAQQKAQQAETDARANNQTAQQQAYNQQTGGGFNGGILNGSYAAPFGNTITGTANTGGGFAGAASTAAPSTGLTPTGPAASGSAGTTGTSGWGGVFSSGNNPWSLS